MIYVPILKGKAGEFGALRQLEMPALSLIKPFFDVARIPLDGDDQPSRTVDQHLDNFVSGITSVWNSDRSGYFDVYDLDLDSRTANGQHPVSYIADALSAASINLVVTSGFDRDDAYQAAVKTAHRKLRSGLCVRLLRDDIDSVAVTINGIEDLAKSVAVGPEETDVILDFRALEPAEVASAVGAASEFINSFPGIDKYRSLIVASSGFPQTMSGIPSGSVKMIPRVELQLWGKLADGNPSVSRVPDYSDYGVVHPDLQDINPRVMRASAKIRYTLDDNWLILKGAGLQSHPRKYKQYHDLSSQLASDHRYLGANFSWGDSYIYDCASEAVGTGNLQKWVQVDTNHHITFVASQIASLGGS